MRIDECIKLNDALIDEITSLEAIIHQFDHTARDIYLDTRFNFDQSMPANFLAWEGSTLVGFLSIYCDNQEDAELSVIVHPDYRQQGIGTALIERARLVQKEFGIEELTFVTEKPFADQHTFLKARYDLNEDESELIMQTDQVLEHVQVTSKIQAREAKTDDLARIAKLQAKAFGETIEDSLEFSKSCMGQVDHTIYVFEKDGLIVGSTAVNTTPAYYYFFSLAVDSDYQGQGVGTAGMYHTMRALEALDKRPFRLAVESDNEPARRLYEKNGFKVLSEVLYLGGK